MSVDVHSFLKKKSNSPGEFANSPGEFENFRLDTGNDTIRCNMVLYLSIISNSKVYILKTRKNSLFENEVSMMGVYNLMVYTTVQIYTF